MTRYWAPAVTAERRYGRPEVGDLIGYDYRPWRVLEVRDLDKSPGDVWEPYEVFVTPTTGPDAGKHYGMKVRGYRGWDVLPEHYAVCVSCGDLSPCRELLDQRETERRVEAAMKAMKVPDGACPACSEPITTRQQTIRFAGPNLLNPLGADGVRFHARRKCRHGAVSYEEKWVAAGLGERSLLTLRCTGTLTVHGDGSGECHGRKDGEDCPNIYARHGSMMACYLLDHGCGQGCSREGHPGTRLRQGLTQDGLFQ